MNTQYTCMIVHQLDIYHLGFFCENASMKLNLWRRETNQSILDCIHLTFLPCVFSNVSLNLSFLGRLCRPCGAGCSARQPGIPRSPLQCTSGTSWYTWFFKSINMKFMSTPDFKVNYEMCVNTWFKSANYLQLFCLFRHFLDMFSYLFSHLNKTIFCFHICFHI